MACRSHSIIRIHQETKSGSCGGIASLFTYCEKAGTGFA